MLQSRPKSAFIESVFIQPSVRKKRLDLDVELAGVKPGDTVAFTATLESMQGRVEKQFTVRVAAFEVAEPALLLTTTANVAPLSPITVAGVV